MEKNIPDNEIIRKAASLRDQIYWGCDPTDPEGLQRDLLEYRSLCERYEFHDIPFDSNGKVGLKDIKGKVLVPACYAGFDQSYIYFENRNRPVPAINETGKVGLVATDGTGNPVSPFVYDSISIFLEDTQLYLVQKDGRYGILNDKGMEELPCEYDEIEEHYSPLHLVRSGDKYGAFQSGEGLIVACEYDEMKEHSTCLYARQGDQWGFFDTKGHFLPNEDLETMDPTHCLTFYEIIPDNFFDD